MRSVVVVDACRTPMGLRHGDLSGWHPADLAGAVLAALVGRNDVDPVTVDEVVLGCATPVGDQGCNLARSAVLAAGWPDSVPGATLESQGASSLRAVAMAAHSIAAGGCDVVVAGGIELSTTTPAGAWVEPGCRPFGPAVVARYAADGGLVPPGVAAETMATRWRLERRDLDEWAARSHRCADRAMKDGRFADEIVSVAGRRWDRERRQCVELALDVAVDEGLGRAVGDPASWPAMFVPGGVVTAANSAPIADGAAALLLMSEDRAAQLGAPTLGRFVGAAAAGSDPRDMFSSVIPATAAVLRRAQVTLGDISRFEIDETFASVLLAWTAELAPDLALVNPDGGAIALGHPLGASGARMLTTLLHGMSRTGADLGLAALGGVGGVASAVILGSPAPIRRH